MRSLIPSLIGIVFVIYTPEYVKCGPRTELRSELPNAQIVVGTGPDIPDGMPTAPRYVVWGLVGLEGVNYDELRALVCDTLDRLGVRFDADAVADTLEMVVVFGGV